MGVPGFFGWILSRHNKSVIDAKHSNSSFYGLYIDGNNLIYDTVGANPPSTHKEVSGMVLAALEDLVSTVAPSRLLFIALDGKSPCQKRAHVQQAEGVNKPGLNFNMKLFKIEFEAELKEFVKRKMKTHSRWKMLKVVISGPRIPGEGEHKILQYFNYYTSLEGSDTRSLHCFYGRDADLVMLSLAHRFSDKIYILRPDGAYKQESKKFIRIGMLSQSLTGDLQIQNASLTINKGFVRDFVFLSFLLGNDYLPPLGSNVTIHDLRTVYALVRPEMGGYIIEDGVLKLERLKKYLRVLLGKLQEESLSPSSNNVGIEYLKGLMWVSQYYFQGHASDCEYTVDRGPSISDILHALDHPVVVKTLLSHNMRTPASDEYDEVDIITMFHPWKRVYLGTSTSPESVQSPPRKWRRCGTYRPPIVTDRCKLVPV